jgi:hypothetical protein
MLTKYWLANLTERYVFGNYDIDETILKEILGKNKLQFQDKNPIIGLK